MKRNFWKPLQIAWLVLAVSTAHISILALNSNDSYCAGAFCERDNDCMAPCACSPSNNMCYDLPQSER